MTGSQPSTASLSFSRGEKGMVLSARFQVSHGPMELGIQVTGRESAVLQAGGMVSPWSQGLLEEIRSVLPLLKMRGETLPVKARWPRVVKRMVRAVQAVDGKELTPMAAVAGAVADEMLARLREIPEGFFSRILVNNGGDMALFSPGAPVTIGIRGTGRNGTAMRNMTVSGGGVATSGWRGRSFSRGIADAVVVVADSGAVADAAATFIGNRVDVTGVAASRRRASELDPMTDIPDVMVTVSCPPLKKEEKQAALDNGRAAVLPLLERSIIRGAGLYLQGESAELGGDTVNFK